MSGAAVTLGTETVVLQFIHGIRRINEPVTELPPPQHAPSPPASPQPPLTSAPNAAPAVTPSTKRPRPSATYDLCAHAFPPVVGKGGDSDTRGRMALPWWLFP
ncbi:unnamed protein product [Merluccius merluccius]